MAVPPTLRRMEIDTALTFLALLSFAALVAMWIAAPLHTEDASQTAAEPASNIIAA